MKYQFQVDLDNILKKINEDAAACDRLITELRTPVKPFYKWLLDGLTGRGFSVKYNQ